MLQTWLAIPLFVRLVLLAAVGLATGGLVNWAIYSLAWNYRPISPWMKGPTGLPVRSWLDRAPVYGWWRLRRERSQFGSWFWVRPLLLEITCGAGLAALYWWETQQFGLFPPLPGPGVKAALAPITHAQFLAHAPLYALLLAATFIDFDEKTIPDSITVTGMLLGLLLAGLMPTSLPPDVYTDNGLTVGPLLAFVGNPPAALEGPRGLAVGVGIVLVWCLALLEKTCTTRRGWYKGLVYLIVSSIRRKSWILWGPLGLITSLYVTLIWWVGGLAWWALITALLGLAFGGAIVWGVRVAGGWALGIEAMGFGDVTLMAMIGTFLGWQSTVVVFFLAPLIALVIAVTQWLLTGRPYIAFGPYLSLAAILLVTAWDAVWTQRAQPYFALGWLIPVTVGVCLVLMAAMLRAWRLVRERLFQWEY